MTSQTSPRNQPEPKDCVEARFGRLMQAGLASEAAVLLELHFAAPLRRKLGKLAMALGGGDEAEHLAHWAIGLAVSKGRSFDPERGKLGTWLYHLARNLGLSQLRKQRPEAPLQETFSASARTVESRLQNKEAFLQVWRRIDSEILRQVLFLDLRHHGQAPGAMARELGLDRATFYKRRSEARHAFREIWTSEFGDPRGSFYGELE